MEKDINFSNILKILLGDEKYLTLLEKVARDNRGKVTILDEFFYDIFNKYCFMILTTGMSKKVEIEKYKLKTATNEIEIESKEFASKYAEYIKIVEKEKFDRIKEML